MTEAQIIQLVDSIFQFGSRCKLLAPVIPMIKSVADLVLPTVIKAWVGLDPKAVVDKLFTLLETHVGHPSMVFCLQVLNRAVDAALPVLLAGILGMGESSDSVVHGPVSVSIDFAD